MIECVPNFSTSDPVVIDRIAAAIDTVGDGVRLLHIDPGKAANRTVFTFAGRPEAVTEAAFCAIAAAAANIDMRQHRGEHPRIGATDVCPLVPVSGLSLEQVAAYARQLGRRVGEELGIPVYLYEAAASRPERRNLATIRAGEYEGLEAKMQRPDWKPDFGPTVFQPRSGATVIGARPFLIAWNVNLATADPAVAGQIARRVRAIGDGKGTPGLFQGLKAIGWYIAEYGCAQVSMNVTDYHTAPLHEVMEACRRLAPEHGTTVTGSELIGLIPLAALLPAGHYYVAAAPADEAALVQAAVEGLGLSHLKAFLPATKILDYQLATAI
jgi:glutamate formiminotransferase / formiminotetrahydrofolate cyclodeaminase